MKNKDYDFTTLIDRSDSGSEKWEYMKRCNPEIPQGIVPFSVADMELKPPPEIIAGLQEYLDSAILGYTRPTSAYWEAVCNWMHKRHDWQIDPAWIVGTPGVVNAIFQAVKAFTEPGEGVIIQTPVYYPFYSAVESNRRVLIKNPLIYSGGSYQIDFDQLEKQACDPRAKILLFCSPHNPVGRVWRREELQRIGEICLANGVFIIADEIHFDLIMPGHKHTVFAGIAEELAQNMMVCTSPSKTFNLAGLQLSNIIIPNAQKRKAMTAVMAGNGLFFLNSVAYQACRIAYTECAEWLDQLLLHIHHNHLQLKGYIKSNIPAIKACPLEGTYLQWLDCRGLGLEQEELEKFMQFKAAMFLDEGYIFGPEGAGFERMNLACPPGVMMQGLKRLAAAVNTIQV